ncbi:MAG: hypothetical protein J6S85_23970 [Methanobrevibacter sp.]|nr:hypothetical protein [Methanobrevibacter sp.]
MAKKLDNVSRETSILDETGKAIYDGIAFTGPIDVNTSLVKSETTGNITRNYIEIPVEIKDENGEKVTVFRKLRNELAVASMATIDILTELRKKSLKMLVLGMAKITDEHAQSVDKTLKTARALIRAKYPEYSDNTINKYRRIGLLFSNDTESATDFSFCEFIDEDVSISNLDVILTLFDGLDVEKATKAERLKAVSDFYGNYIATDMIHLHNSQKELKKEVHEILNPAIEVEAKEVDEKSTDVEQEKSTDVEQEKSTDVEHEKSTDVDSTAETAQKAITALSLIFKGNSEAEKAISILMVEINKLF